jgi:hypothetical protein
MPQPLSNCGSNSVVCRRTTETPELEARVASLEGGVHPPITSATAMRMTATQTQTEQKRKDSSARSAK